MIKNKTDEIKGFARRLNLAVDKYGIPSKGKGRLLAVGELFKVTSKAAGNWLGGVSWPRDQRKFEIAKKLNVNYTWLMTGTGPMNDEVDLEDHSRRNDSEQISENDEIMLSRMLMRISNLESRLKM